MSRFPRERVAWLYCPGNGRPALDPVVMFKALLSATCSASARMRQQVREIKVNVAYRWFLWLRLTDWGKRVYTRRKETIERPFADAKQLHSHRYARFRGLIAVACQCLLAATAQNIKKIALILAKTAPAPA